MSITEIDVDMSKVASDLMEEATQVPDILTSGFACKKCGKVFDTERQLQGHQNAHKGAKEPCPECGELYVPGTGMARHRRSAHSTELTRTHPARRTCPECKKQFRADNLTRHRREVHGIEGPAVRATSKLVPKPRPVPKQEPLRATQIVRAACALIWPFGIPAEYLEEVVRWHTETTLFLDHVQEFS